MSFWDFAASYGPWLLALLGAIVTLFPAAAEGNLRWAVLAAFIAIGFLTSHGEYESHEQSRENFNALNTKITGGNCFLTFGIAGALPPLGDGPPYPLVLFNTCAPLFDVTYWVSHAASPDDPPSVAIGYVERPIASAHMDVVETYAYRTGVRLGPGEYWIRVIARNGRTEEKLIVSPKGFEGQIYYVQQEKNGLHLLLCVPESYCREHLSWAYQSNPTTAPSDVIDIGIPP